MAAKVLIVDGSEADRAGLAKLLADAGFELDDAPDGIEAFEKLLAASYDLVVTEAKLDRLDGPDLIAKLRGHGVKTPVLVVSSVTKAATLAALMKLGIVEYVHKATPPEVIRQKILAALPGVPAPVAAESSKELSGAVVASGAVLIVDASEAEHQRLRAMFPASLPIDGCKAFNDALARARRGNYRLILLDADASVLNLGGIVAQMHVLQPEAAVVAAATLGKNDERTAVTESLGGLGFEDVAFKPFVADEIKLLADRYCTGWDQLVTVAEDLIEVSRLRCRRDHQKRYVHELATRTEAALTGLSNACFDRAIFDLTRVEHLRAAEAAELLARLEAAARTLGIRLVVAVPAAVGVGLHAFQESFAGDSFRWFSSAADARASLG
jgi:PleD family two-component response regulator